MSNNQDKVAIAGDLAGSKAAVVGKPKVPAKGGDRPELTCSNCGYSGTFHKHSKIKSGQRWRCPKCRAVHSDKGVSQHGGYRHGVPGRTVNDRVKDCMARKKTATKGAANA